jgi:cell division protein FtsQ
MSWIVKRLSMVVGAFALILIIVAAVQYRKKSVVAQDGLVIEVVNNPAANNFVNAAGVKEMLFRAFKHDIVGQPLELIDIEEIERVLEEDIFIKNAEIYIDALNKVHITIEQRVPIVRIMDLEDPSYYLDEDGTRVRTSTKFTARVLVVTGNIGRYNANYQNIEKNRLRKKIKFGDPEELIEDKFYRLKVFMEEGLPVQGWEKYKTIDLSFEGQVVGKKR